MIHINDKIKLIDFVNDVRQFKNCDNRHIFIKYKGKY